MAYGAAVGSIAQQGLAPIRLIERLHQRSFLLLAGFFVLWSILIGRLIFISSLWDAEREEHFQAPAQRVGHHVRSRIRDRHGNIIATSVDTLSLYCNPRLIEDKEKTASDLAQIFPLVGKKALLQRLSQGKNFVWLVRNLAPAQHKKILYLGNPYLKFLRDTKRIYPQGALFSHLVGTVDLENTGLSGLEKFFDQQLSRNEGDLVSSLDLKIQNAAHQELAYGIKEFKAAGGVVLVMDLETSELRAMVSLPDYDPNVITNVNDGRLFNRAISGVYEMGSTMKLFNTAMALEKGKMRISRSFDTHSPLKIGRYTITDYRAEYDRLNIAQIFVRSSNKGSARMAQAVGAKAQQEFFQELGLLSRGTVEVPGAARPIYPQRWREANVITASYGYGVAISPLQLMNAAASVIHDGCRKHATLIPGAYKNTSASCHRVVSPQVARTLRQLLYYAVMDGTSGRSYVPGFFVGAKTGTRDMLSITGRYDKNRVSTSYVGLLGTDVDHPKFLVVVMLEDPKRLPKTYGFNAAGWNAALVGGRILNKLAILEGLVPTTKEQTKNFDTTLRRMEFRKKHLQYRHKLIE